ncbi:MAG: oxidoreductase [Proteobacteria bacterium]|nr:oxidoreductase [Pseudomonadota bacterium]
MDKSKPTLAVWKFASCDGCQLSLLDCEDELLKLSENLEIAYFMEASKKNAQGPFDLSLVEGSITTEEDLQRIKWVRSQSTHLVTIGACATSGGIQALRNFTNVKDFVKLVYPKAELISTLSTSTAIAEHVKVDFELQGCPINKYQLLEVCRSFLLGKRPNIPKGAVCIECKQRGNPCIMVTQGVACLGPVTHAGCGALCPTYSRGCYGCYGPKETANPKALAQWFDKELNVPKWQTLHLLRNFNANAEPFTTVSKDYE